MNLVSAAEALDRLKLGNERYVRERIKSPRNDASRREDLADGQEPFASILTCSDSRVPPELVFDKGLGDLFVMRVAGNVCDDAVLGSLEYAALHLGVKLIVVMGHQSCGAVTAAVENADFDGPATQSHIDALIESIRPAVLASGDADGLLERSSRENARMVAAAIRDSEPVMKNMANDGVEVVPAYYDLESGRVEWL